MPDIKALEKLRSYFDSGSTRPYVFRKLQLKKLKQAILDHEQELYQAYFSDLKIKYVHVPDKMFQSIHWFELKTIPEFLIPLPEESESLFVTVLL